MNLSRRHLILGALALPSFADKKAAGETPHIVLMLAENVPAFLLGCYGNQEVQTPSIDRLAKTGTRFTAHIAGAGNPAGARACLLSGRSGGAPETLDKLLASAGYTTHSTLDVLDSAPAKPFFLTLTLSQFTAPYAAGEPYLDRYAASRLQTFEQVPAAANIAEGREMFGANLLPNLRRAAAAVTALDAQVGDVIAKLTQKKLVDNTLVIFAAPSGSLIGRHGLWGGSRGSNPPNFYEEVVTTPMIWSWPGRVAPFATRPELVSGLDLVPTLCDLTPAEQPSGLAGRSYLLIAQNKPLPKKETWRQTAFLTDGEAGVARDDRYKLVLRNGGKGPNELYDLHTDARERVNQIDNPQFLTVRTQLGTELSRWRR
jgi:arylsulfatase A-like enzyme